MLNTIKAMMLCFEWYATDIMTYVVIMVSAIIVLIGLMKPILFNKIASKNIRKAALAFSNVALCFASALVLFWIKAWNFDYYIYAASALSVSCIVTYWFYENTCLRNLIDVIGKIALRKVANIALLTVTKDDVNEVKAELQKTTAELKAQTRNEIKNNVIVTDNDDWEGI